MCVCVYLCVSVSISTCDFSTWISNRHFKFNMPKTELCFLSKISFI